MKGHTYTDEIVCPYCDHEFYESWEYDDYNGEKSVDCQACDKEFILSCNHSVTYSTFKRRG